ARGDRDERPGRPRHAGGRAVARRGPLRPAHAAHGRLRVHAAAAPGPAPLPPDRARGHRLWRVPRPAADVVGGVRRAPHEARRAGRADPRGQARPVGPSPLAPPPEETSPVRAPAAARPSSRRAPLVDAAPLRRLTPPAPAFAPLARAGE